MKKITKLTLTILFLLITTLVIFGGNVQAALQANTNTQYTKTLSLPGWITEIRKMETTGGAMGLTETLETYYTSSESNNIDVHCMKTTEYGAIAILSASAYGHPMVDNENVNAITTTTGNNTGVMLNTSYWEWTAGTGTSTRTGIGNSQTSTIIVDERYYNLYGSAKVGDALAGSSDTNPGCIGWHSATNSTWVSPTGNNAGVGRGFLRGAGGIFSYYGYSNNYGGAHPTVAYYGRGVAVCGEGL